MGVEEKKNKKIISVFISVFLLLPSIVSAKNETLPHSKGNKYFEYDEVKGWWWYKEEIKDEKGRKKTIKVRVSPKEKIQIEQQNRLLNLLQTQNELLKKQNELLKRIQARLDYAFPNLTPKYGIDSKGKKCIANSSSDCFVFPLQPEALHLPVLAKWLKNPNPKNSTEWLKWQAKYFNHLDKIGYGLRFAFLNGGKNAYPTDASITYFDNPTNMQYSRIREFREKQILKSLQDKIGVLVFLGKNILFEKNNNVYKALWQIGRDKGFWAKNVNLMVVFPDRKSLNAVKKILFTDPSYKADVMTQKAWKKLFNEGKVIVNKDMFKRFNVYVTPSVVMTYKKRDKAFWSVVEIGSLSPKAIRESLIRYLKYQGIITPADLQMGDALNAIQKNVKTPEIKLKNKLDYEEDTDKIILKGENNE